MSKFAASLVFCSKGPSHFFVAMGRELSKNKDYMTALMKILGTWDFIIEVLEINAIRTENDHHASFSSVLKIRIMQAFPLQSARFRFLLGSSEHTCVNI